jgi:amino acid permease
MGIVREEGRQATVLAYEWQPGSVLLAMIYFFFIFMLIWMFIAVFADIFRRNDPSGGMKAFWIILIFIIPLLGILIYVIARPKMTEQDKELMAQAQEAQRRAEGYSAADEVAKLAKLRDEGKISAEEYEEMKKRAMLEV